MKKLLFLPILIITCSFLLSACNQQSPLIQNNVDQVKSQPLSQTPSSDEELLKELESSDNPSFNDELSAFEKELM